MSVAVGPGVRSGAFGANPTPASSTPPHPPEPLSPPGRSVVRMNASTPLEGAEGAVARLEAASAARPLEFLDDLAWALLYLGNERQRLGDLEGAVAADERAVARVRAFAELGGAGVSGAPSRGGREISQGGRDIVYLLSSLSYRYLSALSYRYLAGGRARYGVS